MTGWSDHRSGHGVDSLAWLVALRHHDARVGGRQHHRLSRRSAAVSQASKKHTVSSPPLVKFNIRQEACDNGPTPFGYIVQSSSVTAEPHLSCLRTSLTESPPKLTRYLTTGQLRHFPGGWPLSPPGSPYPCISHLNPVGGRRAEVPIPQIWLAFRR